MQTPSNPKLLLICKNFFLDGKRLAALGDNFSVMKSVLFLDYSVEILLNMLINDFAPDVEFARDDVNWTTLWRTATEAVRANNCMTRIPNYRQLRTLHELRNLVQHKGITPSSTDVSRFPHPVEESISKCFQDCYGLDFPKFKLWDIIKNTQLRRFLNESEEALVRGKPEVSLAGCKLAFDKITSAIRYENLSGDAINQIERMSYTMSLPSNYLYDPKLADFTKKLSERIGTEIRKLNDDSEIANLGLSMSETRRFRKITSTLSIATAMSGIMEILMFGEVSVDQYKEYANSALDYLSHLALLAQEVYPEAIERIEIQVPLSEQSF